MKQQHEFKEMVQLVGPHGVCNVEVSLSFSINPNQFSPGMAMIAWNEIQKSVQRIVEEARKTK